MARTRKTTCKSTRGPPHPIQHPYKEPEQEEPEHVPEFMVVDDDDDNDDYYGYYGGGWMDTDTEQEPMELPKDHPAAWTLQKVHSPRFSRGPCRGLVSH